MSQVITENKIWTVEEIRHNLNTSNLWLFRGIVALYKYQTESEKENGITTEGNSVGFNKPDSIFLSSIAKWILGNGILSSKQVYKARIRMAKYAGQLTRIANKIQ